jgi:hypothetical protein
MKQHRGLDLATVAIILRELFAIATISKIGDGEKEKVPDFPMTTRSSAKRYRRKSLQDCWKEEWFDKEGA